MGIKIPLHKKKTSGDKVANDNPPPVFNTHASGDDFLKGHKSNSAHVRTSKTSLTSTSTPEKQDLSNSTSNSNPNHNHNSNSNSNLTTKNNTSLDSLDHQSTHSAGDKSNKSGTTSTQLWIAQANAEARSSPPPLNKKESSYDTYYDEDTVEDDEESYEEEVIEEEVIEGDYMDELPPRKITIRFDEFDEMQTILHINDYTKHEISRSWYKRDDYDKMVALARKTAEKVEERTRELGRKVGKASKKIEYRGLEAWTSIGAARVKILKESAVEAVWNEQSRQWDLGVNDIDRIRELYQLVSKGAQQAAQARGFSDELIAKRIRQIEAEEKDRKRKRKLLGKSKALLGKSVKVTAGGVVKTAKLGVKTTKLTGKVAMKTGRVATKTAVATATLDKRMLKEAIIPAKKKRECRKETIRIAAQNGEKEETPEEQEDDENQDDDSEASLTERGTKKKKSKLKLLGVVPIPGTHKTYREDRREKRIEKRLEKQKRRPSWEKNVSAGKY